MVHYAGIDVSLEQSSVCVVDGAGKIVCEGKVASEPAALIGYFGSLGLALSRVGLEAGPLSQWLYVALREAGLAVELLETRHVHDAFKAMPVKSDRNDARGIAQLMRLGWFRPVHCKSIAAQELRAHAHGAQADAVEASRHREPPAREFCVALGSRLATPRRGALPGGSGSWWPRKPNLEAIAAGAAGGARGAVARVQRLGEAGADHGSQRMCRARLVDIDAGGRPDAWRCPMRAPSMRFRRALSPRNRPAAHFGVTPKKYQSGETDFAERDQQERRCLVARGAPYRAAHVMLTKPGKGCSRPQKLGDADRQARRHAQGRGGAGAHARRDHASHARRHRSVQSRRQVHRIATAEQGERRFAGGSQHHAIPKRSAIAGTMDQVRPHSRDVGTPNQASVNCPKHTTATNPIRRTA